MDLSIILLTCLAFGPILLYLGNHNAAWSRRLGIVFAGALLARYFYWRVTHTVPWGQFDWVGMYMLFVLLIEVAWLVEWCHAYSFFWSRRAGAAPQGGVKALPDAMRRASVDVFIPTYNEGPEIIERTILATRGLQWRGAVAVYVLDDGRRPWLEKMCASLGVHWITRPDNKGAKAGNLNHALGKTRGEFIMVLDADFLAHPEAIERLMPAMADPSVAIAQAPHHFYNEDPVMRSLGTGRHISDDQSLFFDRILHARDRGGFAFFCGTCALIRRTALEECGGVPSGSVTEDILLSLRLRQRGWQTRYVESRVATGLAPETLEALFIQRCRWARGAIQMLYLPSGLLRSGMGLVERLAYMPFYWVISPLVRFSSLLIPQLYLLFGWMPLQNAPIDELVEHLGPVIIAMAGLTAFMHKNRWTPILTGVWADVVAIRLVPNVVRDLVFPFKDMKFHVTPKGREKTKGGTEQWMALAVGIGILFTLSALTLGSFGRWDDPYVEVSILWASLNLMRLLGMMTVLWNSAPQASDPVISIRCEESDGFMLLDGDSERSLAGWTLSEHTLCPPSGEPILNARLAHRVSGRHSARFLASVSPSGRLHFPNVGARARFLSMLVTLRTDAKTPYRPAGAVGRAMLRFFGMHTLLHGTNRSEGDSRGGL